MRKDLEVVMKKIRKALILTLIAALLAVFVLALAAEGESEEVKYTGTVAEAKELLGAAESATTAAAKQNALRDLTDYLVTFPVDPEEEDYEDILTGIDTQRLAVANLYVADLASTDIDTYKNGVKIRALNIFLDSNPLNESLEKYDDFKKAFEEKLEAHNDQVEKNRLAMQSDVIFSDYLQDIDFENDFTNGGKNGSQFTIGNPKDTKTGKENVFGVFSEPNGNEYYLVKYNDTENYVHTHVRSNRPTDNTGSYDCSQGVVVDFDITSFGKLPDGRIVAEHPSITFPDGTTTSIVIFGIDSDGKFRCAGKLIDLNMSGGWTHITLIWTPDCMVDVYIDYQLVYENMDVRVNGYTWDFGMFRIGANAKTGEFAVDNYMMYEGSSLRNVHFLDSKTDDEKFVFLVDGLSDMRSDGKTLLSAYDELVRMLPAYWYDANDNGKYDEGEARTENENIKAALAELFTYSRDGILENVKELRKAEYLELVKVLRDTERSPSTYADRLSQVSKIQKFLDVNIGYILEDEEYEEATELVEAIVTELENEQKISDFVTSVNTFFITTDVNALREDKETIALTVVEFEKNSDVMSLYSKNANFAAFKAAYDKFNSDADEYVADHTEITDTKHFIAIMTFIKPYLDDDGWQTTYYELISSHMNAARQLLDGRIDSYYDGFAEAYAIYEPVSEFFYEERQKEHKAYLERQLELLGKADHYLKKFGIIIQVEAYLEINGVDAEREEFKSLIEAIEAERAAAENEELYYAEAKELAGEKFLEAIAALKASDSYTEQKELLAEAQMYAVTMSIYSDAQSAGLEYIKEVENNLREREERTYLFISALAVYNTAKGADKAFAALVNLYKIKDGVDVGITGAEAALQAYANAISEYGAKAEAENSELSEEVFAAAALSNRLYGTECIFFTLGK